MTPVPDVQRADSGDGQAVGHTTRRAAYNYVALRTILRRRPLLQSRLLYIPGAVVVSIEGETPMTFFDIPEPDTA